MAREQIEVEHTQTPSIDDILIDSLYFVRLFLQIFCETLQNSLEVSCLFLRKYARKVSSNMKILVLIILKHGKTRDKGKLWS